MSTSVSFRVATCNHNTGYSNTLELLEVLSFGNANLTNTLFISEKAEITELLSRVDGNELGKP